MKIDFKSAERSVTRIFPMGSLLLFALASLGAEPEWWTGTPKELLKEARQEGKSIVLYYESKDSSECERMNSETWAMLEEKSASQFLWKRCTSGEPSAEKFFETYQITSTPSIVVLDGERRERGRIQGFIAPDVILGMLEQLPSHDDPDSGRILTFGDGLILTPEQVLDPKFNSAQHSYYLNETFDSIGSIGELDKSRYDLILNPEQSIRIVADEGFTSSSALMIAGSGAPQSPADGAASAVVQINLSTGFNEIDLKLGYLEARFRIRVTKLPPVSLTEVFALTVTPSVHKPPTVADIQGRYRETSRFYPRSGQHTQWAEIVLRSSRPVNMKSDAVWLTFWVNGESSAYVVDDLRVRLMTEAQVKESPHQGVICTIGGRSSASDSENSEGIESNRGLRLSKTSFPRYQVDLINTVEKARGRTFDQWFEESDVDKSGYLEPSEYQR